MKVQTFLLGAIGLLAVGLILAQRTRLPRRYPYLQNFEDAFSGESGFIQPDSIEDDLAVYSVGDGEPVLLMPYPHAHTFEPMAQGPIAEALVEMGWTVITFDVPGAYHSTQKPVGDMAEMLTSATQTLDILGLDDPIDVVGHSMGGLAALAFAIEHPERTKKLVLVGSMSGFPAVLKHGMPKSTWKITAPEYWQFITLGLKVKSGFGTLADHKKLYNIMSQECLHDKRLFIPLEIDLDDHSRGVPIREILWGKNMLRGIDYAGHLALVQSPTLIIVGRYDPEAPRPCSDELHQGILDSRLVVFENSGHSPFLEEPEYFSEVISDFFRP